MTARKAGTRTVVYARISQDRGGERVGVKRQVEDCLQLVQERGFVLAHEPFVDNNVSAYSGKPGPGYRDMVRLIESDGVGVIVVWHIDRPYRSPRELEDLIDLVEGKGMVVVPVTADSTIDLSSSDGILVARRLLEALRRPDARGEVVSILVDKATSRASVLWQER